MPKTKQQIFDFVVKFLVKQGGPALDSQGDCVYKTSDGKKCAIGCLIPDKVYSPVFEGKSIESLLGTFKAFESVKLTQFALENEEFLVALQNTHDSLYARTDEKYWSANFFFKLSAIAKEFNLKTKKLERTKKKWKKKHAHNQ